MKKFFYKNLEFEKKKKEIKNIEKIVFNKCYISNLKIENKNIWKLEIINSNFTNLEIKNNEFKEKVKIFHWYNSKWKINNFVFESNKINDFDIENYEIEELEINNIKNIKDSEITLWELKVNKIILSNIRNLWKIRIYNLDFFEKNKLEVNKKENNKKEKLYSEFNINNSSFWDSEFQNINLESFKKNIFYDNLFSDLKYTGINWKDNISVSLKKEKDLDKKELLSLRDSYRIFKNVAEYNNDSVIANKFFSKEMEIYMLELKKFWRNKKDYFILKIQKFISDFWQNWMKPLWLLILLALITTFNTEIYLNYFYKLNGIFIKWEYFKSFLLFLYPLYWIKKDFLDNFDSLMILWFMIYKILYWIFLWHLIISLKRITKR